MARLVSCPQCAQPIFLAAAQCPHCATPLSTTSAPLRAISAIALGVTLAACPSDDTVDDTGSSGTTSGSSGTSTSTTAGTTDTTSADTSDSSGTTTSSTGGETTATAGTTYDDVGEPEYGVPITDSYEETGPLGSESGSSTGASSGETSGSESSGGSDTVATEESGIPVEPDYGVGITE